MGKIEKKCEVILQKVEMYKEKKNVEKCKKNHQKKIFEEGSKLKSKSKSFIWQEMILGLITLKHNFGPIYPLLV